MNDTDIFLVVAIWFLLFAWTALWYFIGYCVGCSDKKQINKIKGDK